MRRQPGFSLIEVMVTMLLLSIGMLGIAGILVNSIKNNQSSYSRGQASLLAADIVDRMRANRGTAEASPSPYELALTATPAAGGGVPGDDLRQWRAAVAAAVPSGVGAVALDAATRNVTVTIQWDDSRSRGDGATVGLAAQQLVVETHL